MHYDKRTRHPYFKKRALILPVVALAICLLATWILPKPSFLLSDDGKLLGYYNGKILSVSDKASARFARQIWTENLGLTQMILQHFPSQVVRELFVAARICA